VELEQRIKSLEYQVNMMKNEMQLLLLEIHEQVLIHYYPELESVEISSPGNLLQGFVATQQEKTETGKTIAEEADFG
jgi:hypothetical protein